MLSGPARVGDPSKSHLFQLETICAMLEVLQRQIMLDLVRGTNAIFVGI
jgi:hypothetical protein